MVSTWCKMGVVAVGTTVVVITAVGITADNTVGTGVGGAGVGDDNRLSVADSPQAASHKRQQQLTHKSRVWRIIKILFCMILS